MSRSENDAYWGSTETASSALDNFFDDDCDINWTGKSSNNDSPMTVSSKRHVDSAHLTKERGAAPASIVDSIIDNNIQYCTSGDLETTPSSISRGKLAKGVGRAIGEKLDSWKPPSVKIKWNSPGLGGDACMLCHAKNEEIGQLKKRLESSYSHYSLTLPPDDMVCRIILGQPFSLESYRSLDDKLALIDSALNSFDGSAILATVLHLKNTVKKNIFIKEMQLRCHAVQVYVDYLKQRYNYNEAIELLGNLGKHEDAAILMYKWSLAGNSLGTKVKKLNKALQSQFNDHTLTFEANIVKQHNQLLEKQIIIEENDPSFQTNSPDSCRERSLVDTLLYCCTHHWDAAESHPASPSALRKVHSISDRQVLWTALEGRAKVNHWPLPADLESWMGNKGILGALTSFKSALSGTGGLVKASSLPIDQVVYMLQSKDGPSNVLAAYISLVDSMDARLKLAVNCKAHQAVIDVYTAQKDRESLEKYMKEIPAGSPEYLKAENALKNVRWRN